MAFPRSVASDEVSLNKKKIFFGLSTFQLFAMFRRGLFYNYLSIYLRSFCHLSVTETTLFATLPMIINIVFQTFIWGPYSDRFQLRRTFIIIGELLAAVGVIIVWYIHTRTGNYYQAGYIITIGLTVVEIFWSMSNIGWTSYISDVYDENERTGVQGSLSSIGGFGRIFGVWAGGFLYNGFAHYYEGWGFREGLLFFIESAVMVVSVIPIFFIPEGGISEQQRVHEVGNSSNGSSTEKEKPYLLLFVVFLIALCFINFGRNSMNVTSSQYLILESGFHVSSQMLGYIVSMFSLAMVVMGLLMKKSADVSKNELLLIVGTVIAVVSCLMLAWADHVWLIFVSQFLAGISDVIIFSASYTIASLLIPPQRRSQLFGLYNATFFLSWGIAGTFIAGPMIDYLIALGKSEAFAYKMSFNAGALITAAGLLLALWLCYWLMPYHAQKTQRAQKTQETQRIPKHAASS
ncbi:MAG: MFS transporter [Chitinivibrionales bacterium]|nr:MFS transporter [Chitinivibrionales bacterium]